MPASVDDVRMIPASESDRINPGSFYFACLNEKRKTDSQSYWIVMRAPREWLPDGFFDIRPVRERVFPFWILNKDQRVWLPRTSLFYVDRTQKDIFDAKIRLEYTNCFILVDSFINTEAALLHFRNRILESTREYNMRRERIEKSVARRRRSSSMSSIIDNATSKQQPDSNADPKVDANIDTAARTNTNTGAVNGGSIAADAEPVSTHIQPEVSHRQADGPDITHGREKSQSNSKRQSREESALFFPENDDNDNTEDARKKEKDDTAPIRKGRDSGAGQNIVPPKKRQRLNNKAAAPRPTDNTDQEHDADKNGLSNDRDKNNQIQPDPAEIRQSSAAASTSSLKNQQSAAVTKSPGLVQHSSKVKTEEEEQQLARLDAIQNSDRIRVYVHNPNREFFANATMLMQFSPLLHSLIQVNKISGERFIMHPELQRFNAVDLLSVLEYMQSGEYNPYLIRNPDGDDKGPLALNGHLTSSDYSRALAQAARLYTIAKTLQVKEMIDLIVRKVTHGQYKRYSNMALVKFARIVFTRPVQGNGGMPFQATNSEECLDLWIIAELADNFMQIMQAPMEQAEYLDMIEMTKHRQVHACVLEKAASNYRRIGGLPVVIEDSE